MSFGPQPDLYMPPPDDPQVHEPECSAGNPRYIYVKACECGFIRHERARLVPERPAPHWSWLMGPTGHPDPHPADVVEMRRRELAWARARARA
jgi:hypothetical protein